MPAKAERPVRLEDLGETFDLWPTAARLLNIGKNGAYQAAARGEIPTVKIGRRLLVSRRALQRLLDGEPASTPAPVSSLKAL